MVLLLFIPLWGISVQADEPDSSCRIEVFFGPTGGLAPRNFNKIISLLQPNLIDEKPAEKIEKMKKVLMSQFRGKAIPNIEIRYHYYPGWSWNEAEAKPVYNHFH